MRRRPAIAESAGFHRHRTVGNNPVYCGVAFENGESRVLSQDMNLVKNLEKDDA